MPTDAVHTIAPDIAALATPLADLTADPANARLHDETNLAAIAASLERFGQQKPIVIDADGRILAGNGMAAAATKLGWTHLAAVRTKLAGRDATAYAIADNRTAELATWDDERLTGLLEDLRREDDALFATTGFSTRDLDALLDDRNIGQPDPDDVPAPPDDAITQRGDLWILGDHRLLCGDSAADRDVDRLLDGAEIHLVHTDPPYNTKVEPRSNNAIAASLSTFQATHYQQFDAARHDGHVEPTHRKMRPKDRPLDNDFVTPAQFDRMLRSWFGQIARTLVPGRSFYLWSGFWNIFNYPPAITDAGLRFSQMIIWVKEHPVMNRKDFMGNHEWCFYGWKAGAAHYFNPRIRNAPDVWHLARAEGPAADADATDGIILRDADGAELYVAAKPPSKRAHQERIPIDQAVRIHANAEPSDVWTVKKISPQKMVHLTEKPTELALRAMTYSSRRGENVLDLFGGSGSTLIAAEQAHRRAYLMEIDPLYCDVIVTRWENLTGRKAERHGT